MKITDIHTHGIGGFDTDTSSEEQILKIAQLHGRQGVSEIIPTLYPSSVEAMRENMMAIRKALELQAARAVNEKTEAKIIGIHLEGPFLNPSKCGALDAASFLEADEKYFRKIIDGFEDSIKIITVAPEIEGATKLIKIITDMGIIVSMGHSDATYAEAEAGYHAGARGITHIFNAMRGVHHREPGIAGFGLMNNDVYVEVIADPFHLDSKIIELIFAVKNPDRIIIVSDTVKHTASAQPSPALRNENNHLLGGSMTLQESSERLCRMGLNREHVIKALSDNPEAYLERNG